MIKLRNIWAVCALAAIDGPWVAMSANAQMPPYFYSETPADIYRRFYVRPSVDPLIGPSVDSAYYPAGCAQRFRFVSISDIVPEDRGDPSLPYVQVTAPNIYDEDDLASGERSPAITAVATSVSVAVFAYPDCAQLPQGALREFGLNRAELGSYMSVMRTLPDSRGDIRYGQDELRVIFEDLNARMCAEGEGRFIAQQIRYWHPRSIGSCPVAG